MDEMHNIQSPYCQTDSNTEDFNENEAKTQPKLTYDEDDLEIMYLRFYYGDDYSTVMNSNSTKRSVKTLQIEKNHNAFKEKVICATTNTSECVTFGKKNQLKNTANYNTDRKDNSAEPNLQPETLHTCVEKGETTRELNIQSCNTKLKNICNICEYCANTQISLKKHMLLSHGIAKKLSCAHCSFSLAQKRSLGVHIARIHDKIRVYQCAKCDHATASKQELNAHERRKHTIVKYHKCEKCDYFSREESNLIRHTNNIHNPAKLPLLILTKTKVLERDIKKMHTFNHSKYYGSELSWLKYNQERCSKNFVQLKCSDCGYTAKRIQLLKGHQKSVHDNRKDDKCEKCSYSCMLKNILLKHIKRIRHSTNKALLYRKLQIRQKRIEGLNTGRYSTQEQTDNFCELTKNGISSNRNLKSVRHKIKRLQCSDCNYVTNKQYNIKRHYKIHSGIIIKEICNSIIENVCGKNRNCSLKIPINCNENMIYKTKILN